MSDSPAERATDAPSETGSDSPPPLPDAETGTPGSTQSAGRRADESQGRTFPCEGCGASLKFHIGQQKLQCPYCGFEKDLEIPEEDIEERDFRSILARQAELREQTQDNDRLFELQCTSCGGTVVFADSLTSTECPYCATPVQRADARSAENRIPVDGVLPFGVTREEARTNLAHWVNSRWFAPNDFRKRGVQGRFNGVYLPYWTFDSMTSTRYSGWRGEHYWVTVGSGKNKRRERRTRWYAASGSFQRFFDDVLVPAACNMNVKLLHGLEPWPLEECLPFTQDVLAGFPARTYELSLEDGFDDAKERIDAAIEQDVRRRIGGDEQQIDSLRTRCEAVTFKHLLLPVWLLAYKYKDKTYQVTINARSGEVQGERPYSWIKITLAVLAGLAVAGVIAYLAQ